MEIKIDLNDILGDEYGSETLQESVKRQVIERVSEIVTEGVGKKVNEEIARVMNEEIRKAVQIQMPSIVNDLMEVEYTPVNNYGSKGTPTTFRAELVKGIQEHMTYKKTVYSSDANVFTRAIDAVVVEQMTQFKKDFTEKVNANFVQETMEFALDTLRKKLKLEEVQ